MNTLSIIFLLVALASADVQMENLSSPIPPSTSKGDWLCYDNGTPQWLCWEHQYRGVWFNMEDFVPGGNMELELTEMWFFHHTSYPWDTAETYIEFWNGTSSGPADFIERFSVTAEHMAPVTLDHSPDWMIVENQFWIIQNTELSSGGWPSILGDDGGCPVAHSMVSDNMSLWEPFTGLDGTHSELFIRTLGEYPWAHGADLTPQSWGALKTVF